MSVALVILAAGVAYGLGHATTYTSTGRLVLVPVPTDPRDLPQLLDSVTSSGTLGTHVELIGSPETRRSADVSGVDVSVRAVPDTRVIAVTATGATEAVRPAVDAVMAASRREASRLRDPWNLAVLDPASTPSEAAPSRSTIILAAIVLAVLGGVFTAVVAGRRWERESTAPDVPSVLPREEPEAARSPRRRGGKSAVR